MLDFCSYAGAWAIMALTRGAREALCVDSSEAALSVAARNASANGVAVGTQRGDAFDVLDELVRRGERFDAIVLDPPAFIKRKKDIPRGQAAYRKLNQISMRLLERDALLVSCSCSYHLGADELLGLASILVPLGAVGIVASVVPVNDPAAVPLMLALHDALQKGATLPGALLAARKATSGDPLAEATAHSFIALGA